MSENVQFVSHLHFKNPKSAIMTQKIFPWKISIWVSKIRRILCWFQIRSKMHKNENTQNSHSFLALAFFRGISESRHQQIWNQHKILRFFDTHIDIFQEKKFLGHNSTFCNLKMQMRKKLYIFKHFAKYHSPCDSH